MILLELGPAMIITTQESPWRFREQKLENFSLCSPQASQPQSGNKYHEIPHLLLLSSSKLPQYPCLDRICWNHPSFSRCSFQPHVATSSIWVQKKSHTPKKSVYLLNHFEIYIPSGKLTWQWENGTFWRCISLLKTRWFSSQPFWVLTIQPAPFPGCLDDVSAFAPGPCRSKEWDIPQANLVEKKMEHIWGHHEKKRIPKQRYGESFQTFISASYIFEKELKRWFQIVKLGVAFRFVKEMCLSEALFMSLPEALHDMFPISFLHLHPIPIPVQNTRTGVLSVLPRGREMEGNSKNGTNDIEITLMFLKFI